MSFRLPSANVTLMTTMCVCMWAGGRCIARSLSENLKSKHTCAPLSWYLFVNGNVCCTHIQDRSVSVSSSDGTKAFDSTPYCMCKSVTNEGATCNYKLLEGNGSAAYSQAPFKDSAKSQGKVPAGNKLIEVKAESLTLGERFPVLPAKVVAKILLGYTKLNIPLCTHTWHTCATLLWCLIVNGDTRVLHKYMIDLAFDSTSYLSQGVGYCDNFEVAELLVKGGGINDWGVNV